MFKFDVQIAHRVSEVGAAIWDDTSRNYPLASYRWYAFGETVLDDAKPLYILLSLDGEPVARATFWLLRHEPLPVPLKLVRSAMATAFRRWPLLMCRTPLTDISGLILPADPTLRNAALLTFARIAREWGREQGASFTVFDYLDEGEFTLSDFPLIDMAGSSTHLLNRWECFDDYIKQLGASARKDFNRHRNRAADMNLVVQTQDRVTNIDRAMELIRNVERHHDTAPNAYLRRVLENARMVNSTWLTAEIDGRMVGCGLLMGDGSTRILTCLGLDYNVQYVYFQLVYAAVRCGIEAKAQDIRGGGGAYEFKQRLGFETVNNTQIAVVSSSTAFVTLIRRLAG